MNVRSQHIPICWKRRKKITINWEEMSPLVAGFEKHRGWIHMGEVSQFSSRTLAASSCSRVWRAGDGNGRWIGYVSRKALLSNTFYIFGFWTGRCFPNKSPYGSPRPCRASHTSWFWDYELTIFYQCGASQSPLRLTAVHHWFQFLAFLALAFLACTCKITQVPISVEQQWPVAVEQPWVSHVHPMWSPREAPAPGLDLWRIRHDSGQPHGGDGQRFFPLGISWGKN